jgi:4-carboxymuconolactone decarboxylase
MRLKLLSIEELSPAQKTLYADMKTGIQKNFTGFQAIDDGGALVGPWNPWLHWPQYGGPIWELTKALSLSPTLPRPIREIAILVTGAHFHSAYEIYAHVIAAEQKGLHDDTIATIVAGQRPSDLNREQAIAYDVAASLVGSGTLPTLTYQQAVGVFGETATAELIYLIGLYCLVSVTLNGFDVPVPE